MEKPLKAPYQSPLTEVLGIRTEGIICSSGNATMNVTYEEETI
jgi:hypothetical protein